MRHTHAAILTALVFVGGCTSNSANNSNANGGGGSSNAGGGAGVTAQGGSSTSNSGQAGGGAATGTWPSGPAATYDNPILPGDHPDMNVYVEGNEFYLVGSNFAMFPALEILHSTDLIHWERTSRVVNASSSPLQGQTGPGQGTWGAFITKVPSGYRVYYAVNATQWFSSASTLTGPWSEPTKVTSFPVSPDGGAHTFDRGTGSDNSVFVDPGTSKTYMVTKNGLGQWKGDPAVSDFGMNRLVEIDPTTGQLLPDTMINLDFVNWDKAKGGGGPLSDPDYSKWAEGPTLAKRGEWYYYFVQTHSACGGQSDVWASKTLDGDQTHWAWLGYAMGPGDPYDGTQHPSAPFQIADGTWWTFAHSYDCTNNKGTAAQPGEWLGLGREGLLHQVTWVDTDVGGQMIPVPHFTTAARNLPAPQLNQSKTPFLLPVNDEFGAAALGLAWTSYDQMGAKLSVSDRTGWLRIKPDAGTTVWALQKDALRSTASLAKVEFTPSAEGDAAGICVRNGFWDDQQLLSGPTWLEGEAHIVGSFDVSLARTIVNGVDVIRFAYRSRIPVATGGSGNYAALADPVVIAYTEAAPPQEATVWLKLIRDAHSATGWYSTDRRTWKQVGQAIDIKGLDNNYGMANAWVGNQAGMFATGKSADFDLFTYRDGLTAIPAVATDQQLGTSIVTSTGKGKVLGNLENGDWALYGSVDLGSGGVSTTSARFEASSLGGATVEIWLDPLAGGSHFACPVADTGDWETWSVVNCAMPASGTHDVYLRVVGEPGKELVRIASVQFVP